jgi:hypothetical protein
VLYLIVLMVGTIVGTYNMDIPWLLGRKGNGKDTVIRMLSQTLGDEGGGYCTVLEEHMIEAGAKNKSGSNAADPFWHALQGVKMTVASEVERPLNVTGLKKLSEPLGVPQTSRDLYGGAAQWRPMCTFWLLANKPPNGGQDDEAFARRVDLIPLRAEFLSADQLPENPGPHQHLAIKDVKLHAGKAKHELLWWARKLFDVMRACPFDTLGPRPACVKEAINNWLSPTIPMGGPSAAAASSTDEAVEQTVGPIDLWVRRWAGFAPPAVSVSRKELIDLIVKDTKLKPWEVRLRLTQLHMTEKDMTSKRIYEMKNSFGCLQAIGVRAVPFDSVM